MRNVIIINIVLVFFFATLYYGVSREDDEHFNGLDRDSTFVDALYFSTTIQSTVGFGDIHPLSTTGKSIVMLHQAVLFLQMVNVLMSANILRFK